MHRDVALSLLDNGGVICLAAGYLISSTSAHASLSLIPTSHTRATFPLSSLNPDDPSAYKDAVLLATQFTELDKRFLQTPKVEHQCGGNSVAELNKLAVGEMMECLRRSEREVLVIDHTGETARLAVSVLRQARVKAFSVVGGWEALVGCAVEVVKA